MLKKGRREGEWGVIVRYRVSVLHNEKMVVMVAWIYLMPPNYIKNGYGKFCYMYITQIKQNKKLGCWEEKFLKARPGLRECGKLHHYK